MASAEWKDWYRPCYKWYLRCLQLPHFAYQNKCKTISLSPLAKLFGIWSLLLYLLTCCSVLTIIEHSLRTSVTQTPLTLLSRGLTRTRQQRTIKLFWHQLNLNTADRIIVLFCWLFNVHSVAANILILFCFLNSWNFALYLVLKLALHWFHWTKLVSITD